MHKSGNLEIPGWERVSEVMAAHLIEDTPVVPTLSRLQIVGSHLVIPAEIVHAWSDHTTFGEQFLSVMAEFEEEFGSAPLS